MARVPVPMCSEQLAGTRACVREMVSGGSSGEQNKKEKTSKFLEIPASLLH